MEQTLNLHNGETIILRPAKVSDAKQIIHYMQVIAKQSDFLTFGEDEINLTVEEEEQFIEGCTNNENALFLVAEVKGNIVGMLTFIAGTKERVKHVGEAGVSVLSNYWGQGIGQQLIKMLIEWAEGTNTIKKINGRTRTDNARAIRMCKKFGFKEEGVSRKELCINGVFYDFLLLGLEL